MKLRSIATAVAAVALTTSPVLAQVAQTETVRASETSEAKAELEGGSGIIIALLAAAAIVAGIVIAAGNDSDTPTSP